MNRILLITAISLLVGCIANDTLKPNSEGLKSNFCEYSGDDSATLVNPPVSTVPYSNSPTLIPLTLPQLPQKTATTAVIMSHKVFFININTDADFDSNNWELNLKQAMLEWNIGIGYKVFSDKLLNCDTKIDITFVKRPNENDNSVVGSYTGNKCIDSAIKFSTQIDSFKMRKIALHELGHSIGLKHSIYPSDIMFYRVGTDFLSQNDIESARKEIESSCAKISIRIKRE